MKPIISIFLTTAILLQSFSSLIIMAGYEINKDYITRNFCENKSKPMMHCNGKCHMKKQLKEQEKKEQSPNSTSRDKPETVQFCQVDIKLSFDSFAIITTHNSFYAEIPSEEVSFSIFHPPTC